MLKLQDGSEKALWTEYVGRYAAHGLPMANAIQHADAYIQEQRFHLSWCKTKSDHERADRHDRN